MAQGDDVDAIEQAIKNVDKQTQDFAARRMDQSVRRALKGHYRGRGLICQRLLFCLIRISALMALFCEANSGETILDAALRNGIEIEHACERSCACTTCHCIVREGFDSLPESSEQEDDMLDKAWGLEPESRLSCQARVTDKFRGRNPALHYQPCA